MVFGALAFSFVVTIAATYTTSEYKATVYRENREKAFQIAESGINYYVWHLAKNGLDFTDGTTTPQPYVHEFKNNNGDVIGYFSLIITAPSGTSTQAIVESTGWLSNQTQSRRTIRAKFTPHSLTDYAYVSNTSVWIGNDDVVHGKLHSNSGVRFDGTTDAPVTSAVLEYECTPIHGSGCQNETKPGIWGQGGPEPFWSFPVQAEDFANLLDQADVAEPIDVDPHDGPVVENAPQFFGVRDCAFEEFLAAVGDDMDHRPRRLRIGDERAGSGPRRRLASHRIADLLQTSKSVTRHNGGRRGLL